MNRFDRILIGEGVYFTAIPDDRFKTALLSVYFAAPLTREHAAANALIPSVLCRGSAQYPSTMALNRRLEELYGATLSPLVRKRGEIQYTGVFAAFLQDRYALDGDPVGEQVVKLVTDVLLHPHLPGGVFDPEYVSTEKQNRVDFIQGQMNDKRVYAGKRLLEIMCEDEAFGVFEYGGEEEVRACSAQNLHERYRHLIREAPVEIIYVGSDAPVVKQALTAAFCQEDRAALPYAATAVIPAARETKEVAEEMPVEQGKLAIGFRLGTDITRPDYPAAMLFAAIYGATPTGKLFKNVREILSLCYYCSAVPDHIKGLMVVHSGIETANKEQALSEIMRQLSLTQAGEFSETDIQQAKLALQNNLRSVEDSVSSREDWILTQTAAGVELSPRELIRRLAAVTKEEILAAANAVTLDTVYFLKGTGTNSAVPELSTDLQEEK
jgi:predicted Zn-dependent peptidase